MQKLVRNILLASTALMASQLSQAATISGEVRGAGAPIANSTVTLWAATSDNPTQIAQTRTGTDGGFSLTAAAAADASLYLVASGGQPTASKGSGDNPAIALLAVIGNAPPAKVVVN